MGRIAAGLVILFAAACDGDGGALDDDAGAEIPAEACRAGTPWAEGSAAFVERTEMWGLGGLDGAALATADLDGDGWADLVTMDVVTNARGATRVWMNRPSADGRAFVDATAESNLLETRDGSQGRVAGLAAFADIDNDGDVDALTGLWHDASQADVYEGDVSEVLLNDGSGVFSLGPALPYWNDEEAQTRRTSGIAFNDADLDGSIDVFLTYWYEGEPFLRPFGQQPHLFAGNGAGGFTDATETAGLLQSVSGPDVAAGLARRPLFGATACDLNGDGRPDLLGAAYGLFWNLLWVNDGDRFEEVGRAAGIAGDEIGDSFDANGNTFSMACDDIDNDGDIDVYTAETAHPGLGTDVSALLVNETPAAGDVTFSRPDRDALGLGPPPGPTVEEGAQNNGLFDFDNDGWTDVYLAGSADDDRQQAAWLFRQVDGAFRWIGAASGFHHDCPHGIAIADFDHDGDQDIIVGTYGCSTDWDPDPSDGYIPQPFRYYENVASEHNWLSVRLEGSGAGGANGSGIGARVRVTAGGITQTREVHGSWGRAASSRELRAHFGLGAACDIERLEVRWPDSALTVEVFEAVVANQRITIRQGEGRIRYEP